MSSVTVQRVDDELLEAIRAGTDWVVVAAIEYGLKLQLAEQGLASLGIVGFIDRVQLGSEIAWVRDKWPKVGDVVHAKLLYVRDEHYVRLRTLAYEAEQAADQGR